jgi:hypothetical protein
LPTISLTDSSSMEKLPCLRLIKPFSSTIPIQRQTREYFSGVSTFNGPVRSVPGPLSNPECPSATLCVAYVEQLLAQNGQMTIDASADFPGSDIFKKVLDGRVWFGKGRTRVCFSVCSAVATEVVVCDREPIPPANRKAMSRGDTEFRPSLVSAKVVRAISPG